MRGSAGGCLLGTRKLSCLLDHAERAGAKVVGDHRQLPEIEAGGALAALSRTVPTSIPASSMTMTVRGGRAERGPGRSRSARNRSAVEEGMPAPDCSSAAARAARAAPTTWWPDVCQAARAASRA